MEKVILVICTIIIIGGIIAISLYLNNISNEKIEYSNIDNKAENTIAENQQYGENELDSEFVEKVFSKASGYYYYMFKHEKMESGKIPNDIKLRLAWREVSENGKELPEEYVEKTGNSYYYEVDDFKNSIYSIFGKDTKFVNESFSVNEFDGHPDIIYNEKEDRYETNFEFGGSTSGCIEVEIINAEEDGDYLNIYVSPLYLEAVGDEDNPNRFADEVYDVYINYDFEKDEFTNKIYEKLDIMESDYSEKLSNLFYGNYKLDIYKYTFKKVDDEYYFDSFNKVEDIDKNDYKEIKEELDEDDVLHITDATNNNDGTYTLKGVVYTKLVMSKDELEKIAKEGTFKYKSVNDFNEDMEYIVKKDYKDDYPIDYAFLYKWNDEERVWLESRKKDEDSYYIINCAQFPDEWEMTDRYKSITVSGDLVVERDYDEMTVNDYFKTFSKKKDEIRFLTKAFRFSFKDGECIKIIEETLGGL